MNHLDASASKQSGDPQQDQAHPPAGQHPDQGAGSHHEPLHEPLHEPHTEPLAGAAAQEATPRSRRRTLAIALLKVLAVLLATLLVIAAIALLILVTFDWNKARPWLGARASDAIERPVEIRGDLSLTWETPTRGVAGRDTAWSDRLPWPHLMANDVHIGNPAGLPVRDMAALKQVAFSLNPLALLDKRIAIPLLRFEAPAVDLLRRADGKNNWTFKKENKASPWQLDLERVVFTKGALTYQDAIENADLKADIDTINADPAYGVRFTVRGTYHGGPVSGGGKAGAVLSLKQQSAPYPLQADVRMGATRITVVGTLTRPTELAAIDLRLTLAGASMAQLYTLTGVLLPETPPFTTEGRLLGELGADSSRWIYDKFTGKVGSSDIAGRMEYLTGPGRGQAGGKARGKLSGNVSSRLLQFRDLGPLVGADSNASKKARGVDPVQPQGKVLPVEAFRTGRWTAIDADVRYTAERVVRDEQLPISKVNTHVIMQDGVLNLAPLNFDMAGGNITSTIKLDGSGREGKNAIRATAKVSARNVQIKQLFPKMAQAQATVGQINGEARLSSTGNSVASLLGASNGELKALISEGTVSKLLLEQAGLNVGNIVLTTLFGDRPVQLNCMATEFAVTNGLAQTRVFVVDTAEAIITADGAINLGNEQMDLTLRPQTKALRILSLRAPLYVRGSFGKPEVSVDKGVLAMKAGSALALSLAAPVAALLPLVNSGPGKDSGCARLLASAQVKPVAPPPGKRAAP